MYIIILYKKGYNVTPTYEHLDECMILCVRGVLSRGFGYRVQSEYMILFYIIT